MDSEQVTGKVGTGTGVSSDLSDSDILIYTGPSPVRDSSKS